MNVHKQRIMKNFNPLYSFIKTHIRLVLGKISFKPILVGKTVQMPNKETFRIFRHVKIRNKEIYNTPAVFRVKFKTKNMSTRANHRFSVLPIPLFIGLPGFIEKYWMDNDETGYSQGIYQWKSKEHAIAYSKSFAFRFMQKRSVKGSIDFEILDDTKIDQYMEELKGIQSSSKKKNNDITKAYSIFGNTMSHSHQTQL